MSTRRRFLSKQGQGTSPAKTSADPVALVKWLEGADEGRFTHNVSLDWILNYNRESPFPETYAIEWREGVKPRAGWPVIEALVLDVSSDLEYLKGKAKELENVDQRTSTPSNPPYLVDVNSEAFKDLVKALTKGATRGPVSLAASQSQSTTPPPREKVCVGKSLWVDNTIYTLAQSASSPGRMIRPLLRQAFSRRRLISSSYAGQKRLVNGLNRSKPPLKKYQKMADIHAFVLQKFPHISQSSFGALVNNFLGERANTIHNIEYVEESDSDEETEDDL